MNFTEFMKKVDQASEGMTRDNLAALLHDYARSIPEYKREDFLERLRSFGNKTVDRDEIRKQDALDLEETKQKINEIMERLERIDDEEIMLEEVLNEEYNEWYGEGEEEEFFYEDPEDICQTIQEGVKLVHDCVDREWYQECYGLADFLLAMEINADGDYGGNMFSLQELDRQGIVSFDFEGFVMDALLAAYWGNPLEKRPNEIYWALKRYRIQG